MVEDTAEKKRLSQIEAENKEKKAETGKESAVSTQKTDKEEATGVAKESEAGTHTDDESSAVKAEDTKTATEKVVKAPEVQGEKKSDGTHDVKENTQHGGEGNEGAKEDDKHKGDSQEVHNDGESLNPEEVDLENLDVKEEVFVINDEQDRALEEKIDMLVTEEMGLMQKREIQKYLFVGFGVLLVLVWGLLTWREFM